jgi:hypothetical protein
MCPRRRAPATSRCSRNARYLRDLLVATAERWEHTWHQRGRGSNHNMDVHEVLSWCSDESEAWDLVRSVAVNYRHSRARLELLDQMRAWGNAYDFGPLQIPFPRYDREPLKQAESEEGRETSGAMPQKRRPCGWKRSEGP